MKKNLIEEQVLCRESSYGTVSGKVGAFLSKRKSTDRGLLIILGRRASCSVRP